MVCLIVAAELMRPCDGVDMTSWLVVVVDRLLCADGLATLKSVRWLNSSRSGEE